MKRLALTLALAALAGGGSALAGAQSSPPPLPALTASQSADVQRQMDLYRTEINGRVSRGEITGEEGDRLIRWREWQIAQQITGSAPPGPVADAPPARYADAPPGPYADVPPGPIADAPPVRQYYYAPPPSVVYPAPYYYAPYYYAPRPYYWASVCAGGWGHHFGGRICF
jgi:hypothetical protein